MISFPRIMIGILLIYVSIYTGSYGVWTWKKKNKLGAIMVFVLSLAVLGLPIYVLFTND